MSIHSNSLKTLYREQTKDKSIYFKLFSYVIEHYQALKVTSDLYLSIGNEGLLSYRLSSIADILADFRPEMLDIVKYGDVHLAYLINKRVNLQVIITVYNLILSGKTVRDITSTLHISEHTVKMCKDIAANFLSKLYCSLYREKKIA